MIPSPAKVTTRTFSLFSGAFRSDSLRLRDEPSASAISNVRVTLAGTRNAESSVQGVDSLMGSKWIAIEPLQIEIDNSPYGDSFPPVPGCYVIYCDGKPVYVGQTANLENRLYSYNFRYGFGGSIFTPWGTCKTLLVKYRPMRRYGDWAMIELRLIKRLQPIFNCIGSVKKRRPNRG